MILYLVSIDYNNDNNFDFHTVVNFNLYFIVM